MRNCGNPLFRKKKKCSDTSKTFLEDVIISAEELKYLKYPVSLMPMIYLTLKAFRINFTSKYVYSTTYDLPQAYIALQRVQGRKKNTADMNEYKGDH